jgi:flagellar operon protein
MNIKINESLLLAQSAAGISAGAAQPQRNAGDPKFADILTKVSKATPNADASAPSFETAALKFSAHAQSRLKSRNIEISPQTLDKLTSAVEGAAKKGSNNSLILLSDLAFIVNVPNRTVVTALDGDSIRDNVFTNIDSTVLAR